MPTPKNSLHFILKSFRSISGFLDKNNKKKTLLIRILVSAISIADIVGLALMVPALMLTIDHQFLTKSSKLRWLYSTFKFESEGSMLVVIVLLILLFFILKNLLSLWVLRYVRKTSTNIVETLTLKKYKSTIYQDYQTITENGNASFIEKIMNIPFHYVNGIYLSSIQFVAELSIILLIVGVFLIINAKVFLIMTLVMAPCFVLVNMLTRKHIYNIGIQNKTHRENSLSELNIGINGMLDIKFNQLDAYFSKRFLAHNIPFVNNSFKIKNWQAIPSRANEIIALFGVIILVVYGYFISENIGETRLLAAFYALGVFRLIPAVNRLLVSLMDMKLYGYTIDELNTKEMVANNESIVFKTNIHAKNVSFRFADEQKPLFKELDLKILKGETIGLVGESGIGKSMLLKILMGVVEPNKGSVLIDGEGLSKNNVNQWQKKLAYVSQNPFILNNSLEENIAFGIKKNKINSLKVSECIEMAGLSEWAKNHNKKDIILGEGGIKISEGQKQRLSIARSLYKNAEVLLLDEVTSALDKNAEEKVLETIKKLGEQGVTIIMVAHKKTTLKYCQKIYELQNGKILLKFADK